MAIYNDYSEQAQKVLEEADQILTEKQKHWDELNDIVKNSAEGLELDPKQLKQLKDYHHYRERGWFYNPDTGEYDPLTRAKGEKFPDRVSGPFIKFLEIINNCCEAGDIELLDVYFEALAKRGIQVKVNIPVKDKRPNYDDIIDALCAQQSHICALADQLNDSYKKKMDEANICGKRTFNTAINSYHRIKAGKDLSKQLQNLYVDSANDTKFATSLIDENKNNIGND